MSLLYRESWHCEASYYCDRTEGLLYSYFYCHYHFSDYYYSCCYSHYCYCYYCYYYPENRLWFFMRYSWHDKNERSNQRPTTPSVLLKYMDLQQVITASIHAVLMPRLCVQTNLLFWLKPFTFHKKINPDRSTHLMPGFLLSGYRRDEL